MINNKEQSGFVDEIESMELSAYVSPTIRRWRFFLEHKMAVASLTILMIIILGVIIGPMVSPYDPNFDMDFDAIKAPPSMQHLLGTDANGRDVLTRLVYAGRVSLTIGFISTGIAIAIAILMGVSAGYIGGKVDFIVQRIVDIVMALPVLMLIVIIIGFVGPNIYNVMIIIGITTWTGISRLFRSEVLSIRSRDFVLAARCIGVKRNRILLTIIVPSIGPLIIVASTFSIAGAILIESALSFLGIGVQIPNATWGNMLSAAQSIVAIRENYWLWLPPGLLITATVMSIYFIGDAIRNIMDPKLLNR